MRNGRKTRAELLQELRLSRQRVAEFEQSNGKPGGDGLCNAETQFRDIFENTQVGVYRTTPDGRILMANPALVRMLGYSSFEELAQRNLEEQGYEPQYLRSVFRDRIEKEGQVIGLESAWVKRDGATLFVIENARAIRDEHGNTLYYEGTAENITERKKAEKALEESEHRFRAIFDNTSDGIFLLDLEANKFSMCNKTFLQMLGYTQEELMNLTTEDLHPKEDLPFIHSQIQEFRKGGRGIRHDIRFRRRDGSILFTDLSPDPVTLGARRYVLVAVRDVTEQKKAEEKLRQSEERLTAFMDSAPCAFATFDSELNFTAINKVGLEMFPASTMKDAIIGKNMRDFYPGLEESGKHNKYLEVIRTGKPLFIDDIVPHPKFGDVHLSVSAFRVGSGLGLITSDITESKKAGKALEESEHRFRAIFDNAADGIVLADVNGEKLYIGNEAFCRMIGYSPEEIGTLGVADIHPKESLAHVLDDFRRQVRCEISLTRDVPVKRKDGSVLYADINTFPLTLAGKAYLAAIFRDTTERREAEQKVRESEERLRALMDATTESVLLVDDQITILAINRTAARRLGKSVEELIGRSAYELGESTIPPAVLESRAQKVRQAIRSGKPVRFEDERAGMVFDLNMYPILNSEGQVLQVAIFARDITAQKLAERALRESEEKCRTLVENLPQKVFLKDRNSIYVSCNENYARDLGISPELLPGKSDYDFHAAELAEKYRADDKRIMESGEIQDIEEMYIRGGKEMIVHTVKTPVRDQEGNVTGVLGIFWDITEQKRLERALQESEEKYRTLVESAGDAIATIDRDGKFLFINKTASERLGGKPEDYIGKTMWDAFPRETADRQMASVQTVIDTGQGVNYVTQTQLQGQLRWYNTIMEPLTDRSGKIIAALVIARDIHEMRQAETELEAYRGKMAHAERLASMGTLSATLVHELTQPLTVITLSIEDSLAELEKTSCPQTVTEGLRDSLSEVSNVTAIVERFRNFARKSSEKTIDRVELGVVAERIVRLLNKGAQQAGITLHLGRLDKLPAVYLNEKELEQLFFALVQNAVQAADGREGRELVIDGAVKSGYIELRFSDNCGGIQPENLDKLFEPFFTTKPAGEGTGLGLCIVQRIAERSGGGVRVENSPGEGVTFVVTLGIDGNRM